MIPFNWVHLFRQSFRSIAGTRGTHRRLTGRRVLVLAVFWALFVPHQIFTRFCLFLDNLLFPGWRRVKVERPVFITGLFRSGTTYLHRLLAGDTHTFSALKTWEIYLAPSITQRRLLKLAKRADRVLGSPLMSRLRRYNERKLGEIRFHEVDLWKEEEDEGLFLFLWDSLFTWFFFPDTAGIRDYLFADNLMTSRRRRRKMDFYRSCIKRHLYAHPGAPVYLSKNPAFTPKMGTLREAFPDARFICLVRDPARVLVSQAAWFAFCWRYFASPLEPYPFAAELLEMTRHWYTYPLSLIDAADSPNDLILNYRDLVSSPLETVELIYGRFGMTLDDRYRLWLKAETRDAGGYNGAGKLTLEDTGYSTAQVRTMFADIIGRFGFGGGGSSSSGE